MGKSSKETYGAVGSRNCLDIAPEKLVIVTDEKHPLYDERIKLPLDEALVLNIMHQGVLEPVLVRRNPDTGDVEIVDGRQRVRATMEANRRLADQGRPTLAVPAVVRKGSDVSHFGAMISTNEIRQSDAPLVRARKMQRAFEQGLAEEQIATLFGVHVGTVRNYLGVLEASPAVRKALDAGTVTVSDACRIAKLPREEQEAQLAELAVRAPKEAGKRRRRGTLKRTTTEEQKTAGSMSGGVIPRSLDEVRKLKARVEVIDDIKENDRRVALAMLEWLLGNDSAIDFAGPDESAEPVDLGTESAIDDTERSQRSTTEAPLENGACA